MKRSVLLILFCCMGFIAWSQVVDTPPVVLPQVEAPVPKTVVVSISKEEQQRIKDSIDIANLSIEEPIFPQLRYDKLKKQLIEDPIIPFGKKASVITEKEFLREDKDPIFYLVVGLILMYGLIKLAFGKYLSWLFSIFFRSNFRLQQIKDQIQHTPLPSLLLNILFIFVGGVFLLFLSEYYNIISNENTWVLLATYCGIIAGVVVGQYLLLKIVGWLFNITNVTDIYTFIIFLINKMIGIVLLPVIVLMAFPIPTLIPIVITIISLIFVILLLYRFVISYKSIGNEIKVGRFHFFLYLCAFEIAPLLVLGKVLLDYVGTTY